MSNQWVLTTWAEGVVEQGTGPDPATLTPTEKENDQ